MFYRRIRDLREDSDLSQREFAELLGMHRTTYVRYETGEREIPTNVLILIADYYHVSLDYITGRTDNPEIK